MDNKVKFKGKYTGLPFKDKGRGPDGFDCWGLVRWIYLNEYGLVLPDYLGGYSNVQDKPGIQQAIIQGLEDDWIKIDKPEPMALIVFNICKKPVHVGIIFDDQHFLHCPEGDFSRKERYGDRMWRNRIEGCYIHSSMESGRQASPSPL